MTTAIDERTGEGGNMVGARLEEEHKPTVHEAATTGVGDGARSSNVCAVCCWLRLDRLAIGGVGEERNSACAHLPVRQPLPRRHRCTSLGTASFKVFALARNNRTCTLNSRNVFQRKHKCPNTLSSSFSTPDATPYDGESKVVTQLFNYSMWTRRSTTLNGCWDSKNSVTVLSPRYQTRSVHFRHPSRLCCYALTTILHLKVFSQSVHTSIFILHNVFGPLNQAK